VGRFREILDSADDLPVFHVRTLLDDADLSSPPGRDQALDEVVAVLAAMPDSITREELSAEVAKRLEADPGLVKRRMSAAPRERGRQHAHTGPPQEPASQSAAPRTRPGPRENRERALLAMCVDLPKEGREMLGRLTDEHLSGPAAVRARDWLSAHLEDPLVGIDRDDEELFWLVQDVAVRADREPASAAAMEINFLELEQAMLERKIEVAVARGGDPPADLQRQRAEVAERIARQGGGS
jgi:DNA primase